MLEKYITPLLMSYVDKYIKNLSPSDLGVSLWGGDVLLKNLELKLDVLEQEFLFPVRFLSGRIHELRIHIPWTSLGSDSVIVTFDTLECVLTYRDDLKKKKEDKEKENEEKSDSDKGSDSGISDSSAQIAAPSYVQILTQRILNNVEINVNNLIFKYIEDDIVMSVNIKSACMYTVNREWEQAFSDISPPDYRLCRVIELVDLTVCLDRTGPSGKVEVYEEPVLYRAHLTCRSHFSFANSYSFSPSGIFVHVLCDELNLNISDQQFPSFLLLLRRLYYLTGSSDKTKQVVLPTPPPVMSLDEEGWIGWGWSMLGMGSYEDYKRTSPEPISEMHFNFALYIKNITTCFTQVIHSRRKRSAKYQFTPFLNLTLQSVALDCVTKGYYYGYTTVGITNMTATLSDQNEPVFRCGASSADSSLTDHSLFDPSWIIPKYEDKKRATDNETLNFTKYRAMWISVLSTVPELKQRTLDELDQLERCELEQFEIRIIMNKISATITLPMVSSLKYFCGERTVSALIDPLPATPQPKKAVSEKRLGVMSHLSMTCLGGLLFLPGVGQRSANGTRELCMFMGAGKMDIDQHCPLWISQLLKRGPQHQLVTKLCYTNYSIRIIDTTVGLCSMSDLRTNHSIVLLPATSVQTTIRLYCYPESWVSTVQGLLEVRVEVPHISLMLTMPQLYALQHFVHYWSYVVCGIEMSGKMLHGSALSTVINQALLQTEDHPNLEMCVSNIGLKYCRTTVVSSSMITLRGFEVFFYKSIDNAVCLVSAPYFTHSLYKSFDQPVDSHVVPPLAYLALQWPHDQYGPESPPSSRPIVILHTGGVVICWDKCLPSLFSYSPPSNIFGEIIERNLVSAESTSSLPTNPSTTPGSTPAFYTPAGTPIRPPSRSISMPLLRQSPDNSTNVCPITSVSKDIKTPDPVYKTSYWEFLSYLAIQAHLAPIVLVLSKEGTGCPQGDIIEHCQSTLLQALIVCLPSVSLTTENALCGTITPQELPLSVSTTGGLVGDPNTPTTLPWKLKLSDFTVATISPVQQLVSPVSLKITIAPGSRGPNDICLHADTAPVSISINIKQMQLMTHVAYTLLPLLSGGESVEGVPCPLSCADSDVSTIHSYIPECCNEGTGVKDDRPPLLYIWLQYAIPKITLELNSTVCVYMEDITASADLEGLQLIKKFKVGNMTIKMTGEREDSLLFQGTSSDPFLSLTHHNNYGKNRRASFSAKVKPFQVILHHKALKDIVALVEESTMIDTWSLPSSVSPQTTLNTLNYPDIILEIESMEVLLPLITDTKKGLEEDQLSLHIALITAQSQPDNMLSRVVLDKGYHKHLKTTGLGTRTNYQIQLDISGVELTTETRSQPPTTSNITNAAEAWSKRTLSSEKIPTPLCQGLDMKILFAPAVLATRGVNQFGIYAASIELHMEPVRLLVAIDQIHLLHFLFTQYSSLLPASLLEDSDHSSVIIETGALEPSYEPSYELMIAANMMNVMLYERKFSDKEEPQLSPIASTTLNQAVLSTCRISSMSQPSASLIRCSVYKMVINIAHKQDSVVYDGDLQCDTPLFSTLPPDTHTPFITMSWDKSKSSDIVKVMIKHSVKLDLNVWLLVLVTQLTNKLKLEEFVIQPTGTQDRLLSICSVTDSEKEDNGNDLWYLNIPANTIVLEMCSVALRLNDGDIYCGVSGANCIIEDKASDVSCTMKVEGMNIGCGDYPAVSPFDLSMNSVLMKRNGSLMVNVAVPWVCCKIGQYHTKSVITLMDNISEHLKTTSDSAKDLTTTSYVVKGPTETKTEFTMYHHDDLRGAGYPFVIIQPGEQPQAGKISFTQYEMSISWRYPNRRRLVSMVSLPVLLSSYGEECEVIQCKLSYWDEFRACYVLYAEFSVSQVDVATFLLPVNGITARQWKVEMELEVEVWEVKSNTSDLDPVLNRDVEIREAELSSYPALALAGCLCVDSVSSYNPTVALNVEVNWAEFVLLHHVDKTKNLRYKGVPVLQSDTELELLKCYLSNCVLQCDLEDNRTQIQSHLSVDLSYLDYSTLLYKTILQSTLYTGYTKDNTTLQPDYRSENILLHTGTLSLPEVVICDISVARVTITPGLLATLQNTHKSWVLEDNICPLTTYVINSTPYAAQLMVNGTRYLSIPSHTSVPFCWTRSHPVFVAVETVHPAWSEAMDLSTVDSVSDGSIYLLYTNNADNTITITGGLCLVNSTDLVLSCTLLSLDPTTSPNLPTHKVYSLNPHSTNTDIIIPPVEHAMCLGLVKDRMEWSQPIRLHAELPETCSVAISTDCYVVLSISHQLGHYTVTINPLFVVTNNFAEELIVSLSSPEQMVNQSVKLPGQGGSKQVFTLNGTSWHHIGCKMDPSLPLSMPVTYVSSAMIDNTNYLNAPDNKWPFTASKQAGSTAVKSILIPHPEYTERSLEGEIHVGHSADRPKTVLIDFWPTCLFTNSTSLNICVRGSMECPPTNITPGTTKSLFSFKGHMYVGVNDEGITWSPLIELKTSDNKDSSDYFVEVEMTSDTSVCHVLIHVECTANLLLIEIKPCVVLYTKIKLNIKVGGEMVHYDEDKLALYWWTGSLTLELASQQTNTWSYPINLRSLPPRKGINVSSDRPGKPLPVLLCSVDHACTTYITVSLNPAPQILLHNYSEFTFVVAENLPPYLSRETIHSDGDKIVTLRSFRSSYFDPFSSTEKIFLQELDENGFIPKLSFAFYQKTFFSREDTERIKSHKVDLSSSDLITVDIGEDNRVVIKIENMVNMLIVSIFSEFTVIKDKSYHLDPYPKIFYFAHVERLNVILYDDADAAVAQLQAEGISCSLTPNEDEEELKFDIDNAQLDNCINDQAFDFPVVMFTENSISDKKSDLAFVRVKTVFCKSLLNDCKPTLKSFSFGLNKICIHLEDVFLYNLFAVFSQYNLIQQPHLTCIQPPISKTQQTQPQRSFKDTDIPPIVEGLMQELYEPLSAQTFEISEIYVELCVHASVKLFVAADRIPLKFQKFKINKLFTLAEHFSQVLLAKYISDTILQAGWALASLDLLGSPGVMMRNTLNGVRDLVIMPYDGLTRGPTAFVSGIAAGSASLARNISTGVVTSVTNLAVSISRNMDRMSLDEGHTKVCAIHRRSVRAHHIGTGLTKGLTGLGLHLLSAVAGLVQQPIQDINASEGVMGKTKGLLTGVSKGLVGMVTKPLGGAAELVANTGEGLLQGAGWTISPATLPHAIPVQRRDSTLRIATELLQLSNCSDLHVIHCGSIPITVVISHTMIYLMCADMKQCFERSKLHFEYTSATFSIIWSVNEDRSSVDEGLLGKINAMYKEEVVTRSSAADLIATVMAGRVELGALRPLLR